MKSIKSPDLPFTPNTRKPTCPEHKQSLVFNPAVGHWCCSTEKCKVRAQKKEQDAPITTAKMKQLELFPPKDGVIEPDSIELWIDTDPDTEEDRYVLGLYRPDDEPVYVDVTSNVEMLIGEQPNATLCLTFLRVRQ